MTEPKEVQEAGPPYPQRRMKYFVISRTSSHTPGRTILRVGVTSLRASILGATPHRLTWPFTLMTERLLPKPRPTTFRSLLFPLSLLSAIRPPPRAHRCQRTLRATYCGKRRCATGCQKAGDLRRIRLLRCTVRRGARRVVWVGYRQR